MAVRHGKAAYILMSPTATGALEVVSDMANWSVDATTDTVDVTAFGADNKQYVQGLPDVRGSLSGFWSDSIDIVQRASESADGCKLYIYPAGSSVTGYYRAGPAWISVSEGGATTSAITLTANFVANGNWTRNGA